MDARAMVKDDPPGRPLVPLPLTGRTRGRARVVPESRLVPGETADADLVLAARQEPAIFGQLYERYFAVVYGYCLRRLDDRTVAEDACAAIFSRAFASLGSCRHPDRFRSWLFTIAHHEVTDRYRAREPMADIEAVGQTLRDPGRSPEDIAIAAEERRALHTALAALPDDQRHVLELRLAGLAGPEIAAVIGRRQGAVRALQHRAFARLRTLLNDPDETRGRGDRR